MYSPNISRILRLLVLFVVVVVKPLSPSNAFPSTHGLQRILYSKKGDKIAGIYQLKQYLHHYGYFPSYNPNANTEDADDIFDEALESAMKTYQQYYNLDVTGILDFQTLQQMIKPRCGVPDIITGIDNSSVNPNYVFFPGNPTWPQNKTNLSYAFNPNAQPPIDLNEVKAAVASAFASWKGPTIFIFEEISDFDSADIKISFFSGEHGDGSPFDGYGNVVGHSFAPTKGWSHFDKDEKWGKAETPDTIDVESVVLHELGHVLGLAHTPIKEAVMYAYLQYGVPKRSLHRDDSDGIRALYGLAIGKKG